MDARPTAPVETAPGLGWARRVLRQQLDALARLTAIAWRRFELPTPRAAHSGASAWAGLYGLERALRRQVRIEWARRLIDALRARLHAELQALDSGQAPVPPVAAQGVAAETAKRANRAERPERERPERLGESDRFGLQGRAADRKLAAIMQRPTAEIIALICRKLGLPDDWPRLAEEEWAREVADGAWAEPPRASAPRPPPDPSRIAAAPS